MGRHRHIHTNFQIAEWHNTSNPRRLRSLTKAKSGTRKQVINTSGGTNRVVSCRYSGDVHSAPWYPLQQVMLSPTNITIFFSEVGGWERKRPRTQQCISIGWSAPILNTTKPWPWSGLFVKCVVHISPRVSSILWICFCAHEWGYPLAANFKLLCWLTTGGCGWGLPANIPNNVTRGCSNS